MRHPLFSQVVSILCILFLLPSTVGADVILTALPQSPRSSEGESSASGEGRSIPRLLSEKELQDTVGYYRPKLEPRVSSLPDPSVLRQKLATKEAKTQEVASAKPVATVALRELSPEELAATMGGQAAVQLLEQARQLTSAGKDVDAALLYFDVLNSYSLTPAAVQADNGLKTLINRVKNGETTPEAVASFAERIPSFDKLTSVEARYSLIHFLFEEAALARAKGDATGGADFLAMTEDAAWATLQQDQGHPLQIDVASLYYESAQLRGPQDACRAAESLRGLLEDAKPSPATFGARFALDRHIRSYENDPARGYLNSVDLLEPYPKIWTGE